MLVEAMLAALPPLPRIATPAAAPPTHERGGRCERWREGTLDAAEGYVTHEVPHFSVRMPSGEATALSPYVDALLERAYASLSTRYGTVPDNVIRVDFHGDASSFRARVGGESGHHFEGGACDDSVALLSPAAGARNWGETLVHEIAHVFQGSVSRGRVPRWLAEGLAEVDTRTTRAEWRRELDGDLVRIVDGPMPGVVVRLELALTSPQTSRDLGTAYFAAAELVEFLTARHGEAAMRAALARYAAGDDDDEALRAAFGEPLVSVEQAFSASLDAHMRPPPDARLPDIAVVARDGEDDLREAARALLERRTADARARADVVLVSRPNDVVGLYVRARAALYASDAGAANDLERMLDVGLDAPELRAALGSVALLRGDVARARAHAAALIAGAPNRVAGWDLCLRLAERHVPDMDRVRCMRALADLDERASELTTSLFTDAIAREDWTSAREYGERLLYMTPGNATLHEQLARAYAALGDVEAAARERDLARALRAQMSDEQ